MIRLNSSIAYVLDVDASKVIEAVRSTGVTITPAMMHYAHYLISNMKAIGTWSLCSAVYGFVGGTAASHKFNWKDLRDVDAAFRLSYEGSQTNDSNGIKNNSAAAGNALLTHLNVNSGFSYNNFHFGLYINQVGLSTQDDIGVIQTTGSEAYIMGSNVEGTTQRFVTLPSVSSVSVISSQKTGFFCGSKINTAINANFTGKKYTAVGSITSTVSSATKIRIGTRTVSSGTFDTLSSVSRYSFASIGQD